MGGDFEDFFGQLEYIFSNLPKNFRHLGKIFPCCLRLWAGKDFSFNLHNLPKLLGNIKIPKLLDF